MKTLFQQFQASCLLLVMMTLALPYGAASQTTFTHDATQEATSRQLIHRAAQAVDESWEEFHRAAIGGTLASPTIQTQIEGQLHEARGLLMETRKAERRGDHESVKNMTDTLFHLSHEIVQASRETKQ